MARGELYRGNDEQPASTAGYDNDGYLSDNDCVKFVPFERGGMTVDHMRMAKTELGVNPGTKSLQPSKTIVVLRA